MQRPEIHRGRSYRELVKDRELLSICGSREELSDYILDQIRRFTFIENKLDFVSDAANRNYVLSHTRSPSLQRKQASRSSVDVTLSHLSNLYLKISADSHILDLYKQLKDTVEPLCDQQQIFTLEMILLKFSKDVEVESRLVDKVVTIHSFEEVRKLLETSIFKRLRPDAEKIISPLLPEWFQLETKNTYCREDSSNIRRIVRLFLRHLLKDLPQHSTVEGFLCEFTRFPDRLKEFLNKLQKMTEEYGLETARKRGHKLTILIVQSHFIPQLAIFSQKEAADSLCEHRCNNTKAFKKALSIFVWS